MSVRPDYDVVIVGGGPAGATVATFLHKYGPKIRSLIVEREKFPRDHVGESQLPIIGAILHEMEVWDKIEGCGFPIKIGATYRWGRTQDLWDFEFLPDGKLHPQPRPAAYAGQRTNTALQVDRAIYDKVLLDHARWMGAEVREETAVRRVLRTGDRVDGLVLNDGSTVTAKHYIDCSGHVGILRRAMEVDCEYPSSLQNIAIWDYWQNAEWAVKIGVGGTRVQVLSQSCGWVWFIPLGPTRTSIGLIVPAEYYKQCGKKPSELYNEVIQRDPVVSKLIRNATSEGKFATTKDWSFVAQRLAGENWFLAGESCGFADPILAAGMSLAHVGARDVAYTILAIERSDYEEAWLRKRYCETHRHQIYQHVRFADFWYTHNGVFTDLVDFTAVLAKDHGLALTSQEAWRWFGQGGFIDWDSSATGFGGYSMFATKNIAAGFLGDEMHFEITGKTHFRLNIEGADRSWGVNLQNGNISRHRVFKRDGKSLPLSGLAAWFHTVLKDGTKTYKDLQIASAMYVQQNAITDERLPEMRRQFLDILEAMVSDGWIETWSEEGFDAVPDLKVDMTSIIHDNRDA